MKLETMGSLSDPGRTGPRGAFKAPIPIYYDRLGLHAEVHGICMKCRTYFGWRGGVWYGCFNRTCPVYKAKNLST